MAVHEVHEALGDLKEVAIRLEWSKVHIKDEVRVCLNVDLGRFHIERVLALFASLLVNHGQECPVDANRERELVIKRYLPIFAQGTVVRETKVDVLI